MPYMFNGIGTTYYGNRDKGADGFYTTTKFFVLAGFPVLPLSSWRVRPLGRQTGFITRKQNYEIRRLPMHRKQVLNVYAAAIATVAAVIMAINLFARHRPGGGPRTHAATPISVQPISSLPASSVPVQPSAPHQESSPLIRQTPQLTPVPVSNGVLRRRKGSVGTAALKIQTPPSADHVLKLINTRDTKEEMLIYVGRNSTFETKVPLGTYKITAAYGQIWYGEKHLFGEHTSYFRLVLTNGADAFTFSRAKNQILGHHIILTAHFDGNLQTHRIGGNDF